MSVSSLREDSGSSRRQKDEEAADSEKGNLNVKWRQVSGPVRCILTYLTHLYIP